MEEIRWGHDLTIIWFIGMFFSWILNLLILEPDEEQSTARWTFNIVAWPVAILVLCIKGGLEHFPNPKKKK